MWQKQVDCRCPQLYQCFTYHNGLEQALDAWAEARLLEMGWSIASE